MRATSRVILPAAAMMVATMLAAAHDASAASMGKDQQPTPRQRYGVDAPRGTVPVPKGTVPVPRSMTQTPRGTTQTPLGTTAMPAGTTALPPGTSTLPPGMVSGASALPGGTPNPQPRGGVAVPRATSDTIPDRTTFTMPTAASPRSPQTTPAYGTTRVLVPQNKPPRSWY